MKRLGRIAAVPVMRPNERYVKCYIATNHTIVTIAFRAVINSPCVLVSFTDLLSEYTSLYRSSKETKEPINVYNKMYILIQNGIIKIALNIDQFASDS